MQRIIAVDDLDLRNSGTIDIKRTRRVAPIANGFQTFGGGPSIEDDVGVDMWQYHVYSEPPYILNLCSFKDEDLEPWLGRYVVHAEALCWSCAIKTAQFRYVSRNDSTYLEFPGATDVIRSWSVRTVPSAILL